MTKIYYSGGGARIIQGNCLDVMRQLPEASIDSIVCDPPYGLSNVSADAVSETIVQWASGNREYVPSSKRGFMGKAWDAFVPPPAVWDECFRVLKPGGHLLCFAGSRTQDLMGISIRFAGFDIRDNIAWMYGTGFPKSLDLSRAIDKFKGAEREKVRIDSSVVRNPTSIGAGRDGMEGATRPWIQQALEVGYHEKDGDEPVTDEAKQWSGWGTALKPGFEPVVVAQKPFKGTFAANVLEHGVGGLNVDATRIGTAEMKKTRSSGVIISENSSMSGANTGRLDAGTATGRHPANVVLDEEMADALDQQSGIKKSPKSRPRSPDGPAQATWSLGREGGTQVGHGDEGGASRFFHVTGREGEESADRRYEEGSTTFAPTPGARREQAEGASEYFHTAVEDLEERFKYVPKPASSERPEVDGVKHPTVKPLSLMRWLVKLVTPPGGIVFDPFAGSGTTLEAALLEGFRTVGVEMTEEYLPLIKQRIERVLDER